MKNRHQNLHPLSSKGCQLLETDQEEDRAKTPPSSYFSLTVNWKPILLDGRKKRERSWWNRFYERTINYELSKQDYQPLATSTVFALYTSSSMQVQYTRFAFFFFFFSFLNLDDVNRFYTVSILFLDRCSAIVH